VRLVSDSTNPTLDSEPDPWSALGGEDGQGIVELFASLRSRLSTFFEARNCLDPDELADETLQRVVLKICQGTEVSNLVGYSYGVAKRVYLENQRKERVKQAYVDSQKYSVGSDPIDEGNDAQMREQRLKCMKDCLARLKEQSRSLLSEYYKLKGKAGQVHRQQMADDLKISREALSLRVFQLRQKVKRCFHECLQNI
jgi:DNA-directed RNA polymerase specialized sigma24 family protein